MRTAKSRCCKTQQAHHAQSNFKSCRPQKDQASCELPLSSPPMISQIGRTLCFICAWLTWKVGPALELRVRTHANMLRALQPDSVISHHESASNQTASSKLFTLPDLLLKPIEHLCCPEATAVSAEL